MRRLLLALAGLSAVSPLATDMYVPGLPEMARSLGAGTSQAQFSLTGFLLGIIVGQLVLGPLSDAVGRRPVLLAGALSFAGCSLLCAAAPTVDVLNVARVGQGLAGAAGIVVSRAVVADLFHGIRLSRAYATLAAITSIGPVAAPLLGGLMLGFASWRVVFLVLALVALLFTFGVLRWVPESLPRDSRTAGGLGGSLRSTARVARRREVRGPVLALSFAGAAVFAYIAGTSFVFQEVYGLTAGLSSLVYGLNALGNMAGSLAYGRFAGRWPAETLLPATGAVALAGPLVLLVAQATGWGGLGMTWGCLFLSVAAFGVYFPAVMTVAQSRGRDAPGATSALLGSGQFAFGAAVSPLVGAFGTASPVPMATVMALCLGLGVASALASRRAATWSEAPTRNEGPAPRAGPTRGAGGDAVSKKRAGTGMAGPRGRRGTGVVGAQAGGRTGGVGVARVGGARGQGRGRVRM